MEKKKGKRTSVGAFAVEWSLLLGLGSVVGKLYPDSKLTLILGKRNPPNPTLEYTASWRSDLKP
jgi:hypothetical protein